MMSETTTIERIAYNYSMIALQSDPPMFKLKVCWFKVMRMIKSTS